jgi:ubiquinone/menaquinone biosynthesis C-methylase UbiE
MKLYFDYAYNPVYDFTTARLNRYHGLQDRCIGKLELEDNDRVLCIGLGTGNEVVRIFRKNRNVSFVGVDYSHTALRRTLKKVLRLGIDIDVRVMDARCLEFTTGSFDKALCIHVLDFVKEKEEVTKEILRVLKDRGQFVITYPSGKEGTRLGLNLLRDNIRYNLESGKNRFRVFSEPLIQILIGTVYLPLLVRSQSKPYSLGELKGLFMQLPIMNFQIEKDSVYQDYIVYGRK